MKTKSVKVVCCAIVATATLASTGHAENCIRGPIALPGGLNGPPEWDNFDGDTFWRPELHDPRWSGAPFEYLEYPSTGVLATSSEVAVRVLKSGDKLFISYQIESDDAVDGNDYVYLGIKKGTNDRAWAVRVNLEDDGTVIAAPADPDGAGPTTVNIDSPAPKTLDGPITWWTTADSTIADPDWGISTDGKPPWLDAARWDRPSGSPRWAVTLRVDLSAAGLDFTDDPKLFLGANVQRTAGDLLMGSTTPIDDASPDAVGTTGDTIIPKSSTSWEQFHTSGAECTGNVSLVVSDVGRWTGAPGATAGGSLVNTICAGAPCSADANVSNTFRTIARGLDTSAGVSAWDVRVRFRIADWGSTPSYRKFGRWKDITDGDAQSPQGTATFTAQPSAFTNTGAPNVFGWTWFLDDLGGGVADAYMDYKCNPGTDPYCPQLVDESYAHQCMLVEIGQRTSGGVNQQSFNNVAVYRNMDYANLSTLERKAKISIEGLKETHREEKPRDVYVYVEQKNMAPHGEKPFQLPSKVMQFSKALEQNPVRVPRSRPQGNLDLRRGAAAARPATSVAQPPAAAAPEATQERLKTQQADLARIVGNNSELQNGVKVHHAVAMSAEQLLDATWPTYRVRVYYDSGRTFSANGKKDRVLVPMAPFGFRLDHEGDLYGFTNSFKAATGNDLEDLGGGWFKVVIPSEAAIEVVTSITAEEKPIGTPPEVPEKPPETPEQPPQPPEVDKSHRCNCEIVGVKHDAERAAWLSLLVLGAAVTRRRRRHS